MNSEEDVKFKFLVPYLESLGYRQDCIAFNVSIPVQEGRKKKTIFADAIVYKTKAHKAPLVVCETKAPTEILDRSAREQVISYARLLPQIAPLALLTNGAQVHVFHTFHKTRLPALPGRRELDTDIVTFVLNKDAREALRREARHDLFIIDDVQTFKRVLKSCHNEIRNNEGLDPTAAFDEMSKVMFCKLFEEKENTQGNRFRLSVFDDSMERLRFNVVRKIFDDARASPAYAGLFADDTQIFLKDRTIRKIVELFESYDLGLTAFDVKGEAFEYFLGDTFTGGLGEYFTPRNIVEFMVDAVDPKIGDKIIDPFCGTGGFLIYAFELVSQKIRLQEFSESEKERWRFELSERCLYGTDWKERTSQACKMNMMVHGDGSSGIFMHDGLIDVNDKIGEGQFDLCITNPPFGSFETDADILNRFELGTGRKSQDRVILALERSLNLVRPGGIVAIVVIDGILNNRSTKYVRDHLREHAWIRGIVSLNKETFQGYGARAKTSVLFLERKDEQDEGTQGPVFMAIADNTGLAPNGAPIAGNVLPDLFLDYRTFLAGEYNDDDSASNSWLAQVSDRLDAEYYSGGTVSSASEIAPILEDVEASLSTAASLSGTLCDINDVFSRMDLVKTKLRDVLEEVSHRERLDPNQCYRLLGVRWWGEGVFERERKMGRDIKAKSAFRVAKGAIIYNRLFAFRGSFAVVPDDMDGCHVSNEFPTFVCKEEVPNPDVMSRYIVHCLNSRQYRNIVDTMSTGSTKTSRNRFSQVQFLDLSVMVPRASGDVERAVDTFERVIELKVTQDRLLELSKALREEVLALVPLGLTGEGS